MMAWRPELGKGSPIALELPARHAHRAVARRFGAFEVLNLYLPAAGADLPLALGLQEDMAPTSRSEEGPKIMAGDWNWKPRYRDLLVGEWRQVPSPPTVKGSRATPDRVVARALVDPAIEVVEFASVPHHKAVVLSFEAPVPPPSAAAAVEEDSHLPVE